ncbi:MAG: hypothetical protein QOH59_3079 [Gemmatimonadales bacterium]|jgi:hypothetical protein|nr:hypothetical protein [Gemmatimonadales bacterium]
MKFGLALALGLTLLTACDVRESQQARVGRLEAQWAGTDSGKISAPAAAEWCAERLWLEVRAIQGDTGLAMALYPVDSIVTDSYPIVDPTRADSVRPSASLGLRLFSQTAVKGYRGDSGAVLLVRSSSGQLSGKVTARARGVPNGEPVRLSGKFDRVAVLAQERGCVAGSPDSSADSPQDSSDGADPADGQVD